MLKELNSKTVAKPIYPIKVLQFGEGNFLRAFVDWMIQKANNSLGLQMGLVIVQPLANGMIDKLNQQDNMYHVVLEGIKDGKPIREIDLIDCIQDAVNPYTDFEKYRAYFLNPDLEFVISNTTEAGISRIDNEDIFAHPPISFPGKVCALLHERYKKYHGANNKGLTFICCELIENNATALKEIVLELCDNNELGNDFIRWIHQSCTFCNSLVDRIVTGFPKDTVEDIQAELAYKDNMLVTAEYYHVWAIEDKANVKASLPLDKAGLNVVWTKELAAFRDKKVRVLNGAHTALVPIGILAGYQTVKEAFNDEYISSFIQKIINDEVLPNIKGNADELNTFANEILERFHNPYIKHYLKDISLNSLSKWMTRNHPSFNDSYQKTGSLPKYLSLSLAALMYLYSPYNSVAFIANDIPAHLSAINEVWKSDQTIINKVDAILSNDAIWGMKLNKYNGLVEHVSHLISEIEKQGILAVLKTL